MNVTVLGCGRWGTFLAWYSVKTGHKTLLWGRKTSDRYQTLVEQRKNEYLTLPDSLLLTDSLEDALSFGDLVLISISAQEFRRFAGMLRVLLDGKYKIYVLCMKGLEAVSGKRLSEIFAEEMSDSVPVAVWLGPGHVQDFVNGIPNCMVIGSNDTTVTKTVIDALNSDLIRFYYGQDLIGNEIGAAAKNVIGIAAGILDGLSYGSLKGALMARGAREISRLVKAMGGDDITVYGLSHLGDYEATLFSPYSHNRQFGEDLVKNKTFPKLAEGVSTLQALQCLKERYNVDLPICDALYKVLFQGADVRKTLPELFLRPLKTEF